MQRPDKSISCGGISEITNLITVCSICNSSKHANELSDEVKIRILKVLAERNKHLGIQQISAIEKEIMELRKIDGNRRMKSK